MTLLLEVEDGVVIVRGEGDWLTRLEMVRIAGSLGPDREIMAALTKRGRGIFSRSIIDALGPTFGPLYEPGYVPKGYVPRGSPYAIPTIMERVGVGIRQVALNNELILPYMSHHCQLSVHQHRRGSGRGPNLARRAIEYPSDSDVKVTPEGPSIYRGVQGRVRIRTRHRALRQRACSCARPGRRPLLLRITGSSARGPGSASRRGHGRAATHLA